MGDRERQEGIEKYKRDENCTCQTMSEKPAKNLKTTTSRNNVNPSPRFDMNDQKYRTLIHLLAVNWNAIKPISERPEILTWNRRQFDYIMGIAYGDGYTEDIGSSIWDKISYKYWNNISEDVNNVRGSKNMLEAPNNIIAPANRYYYNMYATFCQNLMNLHYDDGNVSCSNKQRITKFLQNFNLDNPKISNFEIFELALPEPKYSLKDYQKFKKSLTGYRKPIATMMFGHYFKGHPYVMQPYIPPDVDIVMPKDL